MEARSTEYIMTCLYVNMTGLSKSLQMEIGMRRRTCNGRPRGRPGAAWRTR